MAQSIELSGGQIGMVGKAHPTWLLGCGLKVVLWSLMCIKGFKDCHSWWGGLGLLFYNK